MNDGVTANERFANFLRIAQVASHEGKALLPLRPHGIRLERFESGLGVKHEIEHPHIVAERKKMRNQSAADVAETTCDEDF